MPLDPMMSDAILGTFRKMADELKSKNLSGENIDKMMQTLDRMKELANTHSDMNAFNGQVMQENLYGKFSDYYGKAMSAQAAASGSSAGGGNAEPDYLKQNLDALRDCIKRIRTAKEDVLKKDKEFDPKKAMQEGMDYVERNKGKLGLEKGIKMSGGIDALKNEAEKDIDKTIKEKPNAYDNSVEIEILINDEGVIKPIENLIALGEQPGMTYPRYLRIQIEKGLDKAMEGNAVTREGYEYSYEFYKAMARCPHHIEKAKKKLDLFDELGAKSKFGIPNMDEISYGHRRIDHEFEPSIILWDTIVNRWETLVWDLYDWSLAHISIATQIEPWSLAKDPPREVKKTKDIQPGLFRQRERLFKKYFGLEFPDVPKHPTFRYYVENNFMWESQELFEFLLYKVYPQCQPFKFLPQDLINEREGIYKEKREMNPDLNKPIEKFIAFYDCKFGEGRYVSKFGAPKPVVTNAKPWNWNF
jgi:hypothetical protein